MLKRHIIQSWDIKCRKLQFREKNKYVISIQQFNNDIFAFWSLKDYPLINLDKQNEVE